MDQAPSTAEESGPSLAATALALVGFVVVSLAAGAIGGWATAGSVDTWYPTLDKPAFTPPGSVISTVWTVLYVVMGVAAWRVWRRVGTAAEPGPLTLFGIQLALNAVWSLVFFGLQSPGGALVEVLALGAAVAATTLSFWRVDRWAGWLMVPYLAWVAFATVLNATIWWMN